MATLHLRHVFRPATNAAAAGDRPPLLVLLHGTGADEHDLLDVGERLQASLGGQLAVCSLRAPLRGAYGGYAWFEGYSSAPEERALSHTIASSTAAVCSVLEQAPELFNTGQTYLLGFSQGASIGWSVTTSTWGRPDLLSGSLLLSGRLFPQHALLETPLGATVAPRAQLHGRRAWVTHGQADGVSPVSLAHESLRTAGELWGGSELLARDVELRVHSGGHEIPASVLGTAATVLEAWIRAAAAAR